jgi:CheY-like chemotaxis protein
VRDSVSVAKIVPHRVSEAILIVDDDPAVLKICRLILWRAGYKVLAASSGVEALGICRELDSSIHLALIDVIMPGMNGIELAKSLQQLNQPIRIVFMSGYGMEEIKELIGKGTSAYRIIWKPFEPETLVRMLRNVLDEPLRRGKETGGG